MSKQWKCFDRPSYSPDLDPADHETREAEGKKSQKQAGSKDGFNTGLEKEDIKYLQM